MSILSKKSVASVLKAASKVVSDLREVESNALEGVNKEQDTINKAEERRDEHTREAFKANKLATKWAALIGEE